MQPTYTPVDRRGWATRAFDRTYAGLAATVDLASDTVWRLANKAVVPALVYICFLGATSCMAMDQDLGRLALRLDDIVSGQTNDHTPL
jgi:hypothetical protein